MRVRRERTVVHTRNVGSLSITDVYFGRDVRIRRLLRESGTYRTQGGKLSVPASLGATLAGNTRADEFFNARGFILQAGRMVSFFLRAQRLCR